MSPKVIRYNLALDRWECRQEHTLLDRANELVDLMFRHPDAVVEMKGTLR